MRFRTRSSATLILLNLKLLRLCFIGCTIQVGRIIQGVIENANRSGNYCAANQCSMCCGPTISRPWSLRSRLRSGSRLRPKSLRSRLRSGSRLRPKSLRPRSRLGPSAGPSPGPGPGPTSGPGFGPGPGPSCRPRFRSRSQQCHRFVHEPLSLIRSAFDDVFGVRRSAASLSLIFARQPQFKERRCLNSSALVQGNANRCCAFGRPIASPTAALGFYGNTDGKRKKTRGFHTRLETLSRFLSGCRRFSTLRSRRLFLQRADSTSH